MRRYKAKEHKVKYHQTERHSCNRMAEEADARQR